MNDDNKNNYHTTCSKKYMISFLKTQFKYWSFFLLRVCTMYLEMITTLVSLVSLFWPRSKILYF